MNKLAVCGSVAVWVALAFPARATCDKSQPDRTPTSRYVITGATVYDKKTDLTWQRCSVGQKWKDGIGCVGIVQTLKSDESMGQATGNWRIPTENELYSLLALNCKNFSINEAVFPDTGVNYYWSSTADGSYTYMLEFRNGNANFFTTALSAGSLRLVRTGQ